jgi:hypothetical protein
MKQITKCHALQVQGLEKRRELGGRVVYLCVCVCVAWCVWSVCVCVFVCVVCVCVCVVCACACVVSLAALRFHFPFSSGDLVVSMIQMGPWDTSDTFP